MLRYTEDEKRSVEEYFNWQAPDLKITMLQKVYSEALVGHRHDVWDVHTDKDRWWVITNPTNLYSQEQFPNMDLAVTFHMGLCLRIPRTEKQKLSDRMVLPFGSVFSALEDAKESLTQAQNVADYQAVGMRSREVLLALVGAAQDAIEWEGDELPKRADFRGWTEVIANQVLPGKSQKERRHLFKTLMSEAWTFSNWLTHAQSATWHDADAGVSTVEHVVGFASSLVIRFARDVPEECPKCSSPHLTPEEGRRSDRPEVVWERPTCSACGWTGNPVPVSLEPLAEDDELLIREGGNADDDECIIPSVPLRGLKKPTD